MGGFLHTCHQCGHTFAHKASIKKFCSSSCYVDSQRGMQRKPGGMGFEHLCRQCGASFRANDRRRNFCSTICYHISTQGHKTIDDGTVFKAHDGYLYRRNPDHPRASHGGLYVLEHILIAETALGHHLAQPAEVHHLNGIRNDNRHSNLVICENRAYHMLLHRRQRILAAGGNPDCERKCTRCKQIKPTSQFNRNRNTRQGFYGMCRPCCSVYKKSRNAK